MSEYDATSAMLDTIGKYHLVDQVQLYSSCWQETITGNMPYHELERDHAVIAAILFKKNPPKRPEMHIPTNSAHGDTLWSLLINCWTYEPGGRPSAAEVQVEVGTTLCHNIT